MPKRRKSAAAPKKPPKKAKPPPTKEEDDDLSEGWEDAGSVPEEAEDEDAEDDDDDDDEVPATNTSKFGKVVSGQAEARSANPSQVFVGGLPWDATEEQLRNFFAKHGDIADVSFPAKTAYVTFKKLEAAKAAVESNGAAFGSNTLKVNQRLSKGAGKGEQPPKVDYRGKKKGKGAGTGRGKGKGKKDKKTGKKSD